MMTEERLREIEAGLVNYGVGQELCEEVRRLRQVLQNRTEQVLHLNQEKMSLHHEAELASALLQESRVYIFRNIITAERKANLARRVDVFLWSRP